MLRIRPCSGLLIILSMESTPNNRPCSYFALSSTFMSKNGVSTFKLSKWRQIGASNDPFQITTVFRLRVSHAHAPPCTCTRAYKVLHSYAHARTHTHTHTHRSIVYDKNNQEQEHQQSNGGRKLLKYGKKIFSLVDSFLK